MVYTVPWLVRLGMVAWYNDDATVYGNNCKLLRDRGCKTVDVRRSLIPDDSYTERFVHVRTFCWKDRIFPTAIVELKSNYFTGRVEACVLDNPMADVILGNICGINVKPSLEVQPLSANPV